MSEAARYQRWRRVFAAAVEENRRIDQRAPIVDRSLGPGSAAGGACIVLSRRGVEYWFPRDGTVGTWRDVRARGYAACSEAAALATAIALNRGADSVTLCIEEHPTIPGYSHVAAIVEGQRVDCYADQAIPVGGCRFRWPYTDRGWTL